MKIIDKKRAIKERGADKTSQIESGRLATLIQFGSLLDNLKFCVSVPKLEVVDPKTLDFTHDLLTWLIKTKQTRDQIEFSLVDLEVSNIMLPELLLGVKNALTRGNEFIKTNYKQWSELYPAKIYKKNMEDIKTNIAETLRQLEEIPSDMKEILEKTHMWRQKQLRNRDITSWIYI